MEYHARPAKSLHLGQPPPPCTQTPKSFCSCLTSTPTNLQGFFIILPISTLWPSSQDLQRFWYPSKTFQRNNFFVSLLLGLLFGFLFGVCSDFCSELVLALLHSLSPPSPFTWPRNSQRGCSRCMRAAGCRRRRLRSGRGMPKAGQHEPYRIVFLT